MSRPRALLALLLALTWCSAVAHAHLEAIGWMPDHGHYAPHAAHGCGELPGDCPEGHEEVFANHLAKDGQLRLFSAATFRLFAPATAQDLFAVLAPSATEARALAICGQGDPPGVTEWRFVQRCAPEPAAPPGLG